MESAALCMSQDQGHIKGQPQAVTVSANNLGFHDLLQDLEKQKTAPHKFLTKQMKCPRLKVGFQSPGHARRLNIVLIVTMGVGVFRA